MKFRQYRVAVQKFNIDKGSLNASALTFYMMFALVPMLAAIIGIARGFGLDTFLQEQISKAFVGQESIILFLNQYADNLLIQSTKEIVSGVAVIVLLYSAYSMLTHVEHSMNDIWQVTISRNIMRRVNNYLSLILLAPIILVLVSSLKILIIKILPEYNILLIAIGNLLSFILLLVLFYWFYKYMPNTFVETKAAQFAALHAGLAYFILQSILIKSQLFLTNYNAIYGSLAALPLFLIWVQAGWIIVLFGAQLSFVHQNNIQAIWEIDLNNVSIKDRNSLYTKITRICTEKFNLQQPLLTAKELSKEINISYCITKQLIKVLVSAKLLIPVITNNRECYMPAQHSDVLNDNYILNAINNIGISLET